MREIMIGVLASLFFAVTFILNRSMELAGGSWMWSSSLRFMFMVPFLVFIVYMRKNMRQLFQEMRRQPWQWLCWSTIGFGFFYAPITIAASYGPGWLVAGTWQLTIIAGVLLTPLFFETIHLKNGPVKVRKKVPLRALGISSVILFGVMLIQFEKAGSLTGVELIVGVLPVVVAAFAYPLGNRKMMEVCGGRLDTFQRVLGMTLASLPLWIVISIAGYVMAGPPASSQVLQTLIVAISSGVIATTLFFIATDRVREHPGKLASVEATQSTQVLFVLFGELLLLSSPMPSGVVLTGLFIIIIGMLFHSFYSNKTNTKNAILMKKEEQNI